MKIMDRVETLNYIKDRMKTERMVVPRYNDGEYLTMNRKQHSTHTQRDFAVLPGLLKRAIKARGQLVCVNYLKPHNIERRDVWYYTQKYLIDASNHDLYGCGNWILYDFQNDNEVFPLFFAGRTLLVTGHAEESLAAFEGVQPDVEVFATPKRDAASKYEEMKSELIELCKANKFDNINFSCGPVGKVLAVDLIPVCECNMIDVGAFLNAVVNESSRGNTPLVKQWPMSWARETDIKACSTKFFERLESL